MLIVSGIAVSGSVVAQYAPPVGSVTLVTTNSSPGAGSAVVITTQVLDVNGVPIAGEQCSFAIASEPGTDASFATSPMTVTDAQGIASTTLNVGSTSGLVIVKASCLGMESQVLVQVSRPRPPAAPLDRLQAPNTGDGGLR
ncbi:MAG TPA: hypothetical protein VI759_02975 [Dehalococcoidia bacterium]|nr:hypothetical protein [Dehalococcoidia bacterium]